MSQLTTNFIRSISYIGKGFFCCHSGLRVLGVCLYCQSCRGTCKAMWLRKLSELGQPMSSCIFFSCLCMWFCKLCQSENSSTAIVVLLAVPAEAVVILRSTCTVLRLPVGYALLHWLWGKLLSRQDETFCVDQRPSNTATYEVFPGSTFVRGPRARCIEHQPTCCRYIRHVRGPACFAIETIVHALPLDYCLQQMVCKACTGNRLQKPEA